jgi:tetrahydromethanopterin S-methyltransferase subunit G
MAKAQRGLEGQGDGYRSAPGRSLMTNGVFRRLLLGLLAGAASCWVLASSCDQRNLGVVFGLVLGAYLETIMTSATMGLPLWGLISIIVLPLSRREEPLWSAAGMRDQFPELIVWLLYGALVGLLIQAITHLTDRFLGPVREVAPPVPPVRCRVLILGGGNIGTRLVTSLWPGRTANRACPR